MNSRKFNFPLSLLIRQADLLYRALIDKEFSAAMAERLNMEGDTAENNAATRFKKKLELLGTEDADQGGKAGQAGELTLQQKEALKSLTRLCSDARRSAKLAFAGQKVRLHKEFQIGVGFPVDAAAVVQRARMILGSCVTHAAALKAHGWLPRDADALSAALQQFEGFGVAKTGALGRRVEVTRGKILAANAVYVDCLRIQNAARLEYPADQPGNDAVRRRFLLGQFPPRSRPAPPAQTPIPPSEPGTAPVRPALLEG